MLGVGTFQPFNHFFRRKPGTVPGGWPSRTLPRHGVPHPWQFHGWAAANSPWHVHRSQRNRCVPVTSFQWRVAILFFLDTILAFFARWEPPTYTS